MSPSVSLNFRAARSTSAARRIVGDEPARQLGGDEAGRGRMPREQVEDGVAVALAAARLDALAQHDLLAIVVPARIEVESAAEPRVGDRPARERPRNFLHILLRVAAVDAERVQFHQLARVVLVDAPAALLRRHRRVAGHLPAAHVGILQPPAAVRQAGVRAWHAAAHGIAVALGIRRGGGAFGRGALPVVEIEEHRRAVRRRAQQIAELAEHPRADGVALVLGQVVPHLALAHEHVEVIHPEVDEDLFELALAVGRTQDPLLRQLADDGALHPHRLGLLGRPRRQPGRSPAAGRSRPSARHAAARRGVRSSRA